jgi:hypothetical protein
MSSRAKRTWPLRRVTEYTYQPSSDRRTEILDCGHVQPPRTGQAPAARRRCLQCEERDQGRLFARPEPAADDILDFPCPTKGCKAPPGIPCGTPEGRALAEFHPARIRRARNAMQ